MSRNLTMEVLQNDKSHRSLVRNDPTVMGRWKLWPKWSSLGADRLQIHLTCSKPALIAKKKVTTMTTNARRNELTRVWCDEFVEAAVTFLVGCLDCGLRVIEDSCTKVLTDFGPEIVPQLRRIVRRDGLSFGHSLAVIGVIDTLTAAGRRSPGITARLCECMTLMIKRNKMELVRQGLELAKYLPQRALSNFLVDAALVHRSEGRYFDRLLLAVELTGECPSRPQLDQLRRIYESKERPIARSCKRLLEKIHRGELRDPSCTDGFVQHPATPEEPDDLSIHSQYLLQLRGCSIRRGRKGSITCQVWHHERIIECITPVNGEY